MKALRGADALLPADAERALEVAPSQRRGLGTSYALYHVLAPRTGGLPGTSARG